MTRVDRFKIKDLLVVEGMLIIRERGVLLDIVTIVGLELMVAVRFDLIVISDAKLSQILLV